MVRSIGLVLVGLLIACSSSSSGSDGGSDSSTGGPTCASVCGKACTAAADKTSCEQNCATIPPSCKTQFNAYGACIEKNTSTCMGGQPTSAACSNELSAINACVSGSFDSGSTPTCASVCAKACMGADKTTCEQSCAMIPPSCKTEFTAFGTCIEKSSSPTCMGGNPSSSTCTNELAAINACVSMSMDAGTD